MDGPESDPSAVLAEPSSSPHGIADLDAYEEAQLDQIEAEIEAEKRNVFISSLKDTTDLQELVQRAKASHLAGAVQALSRAGITTADDIVCLPRTEVCTKGRLTNEVYYSLLQHASMPFLPQMYAASEWREHQNARLSLGCPTMDAFLRGGLRPYGITELAGEAGAGKSQICMQLCATVQLPSILGGLDSAAMYISTEGQFPQRRFAQIAAALQQRHPEMEAHDFLARVVLESAPTAQRLLEILSTTARPIINRYNVRLLIVDSIAAVFREFGNDEILERAKLLWRIAQQLKFLADGSGGGPRVLVLVTNQVSQRLDGVASLDAGRVVPALGLSWAASVNTRLLVRRTARKTEPLADNTHHSSVVVGAKRSAEAAQLQEDDEKSSRAMGLLAVREMNVAFAPHLPRSSTHSGCCYFIVDRAGVAAVGAPGREGEADRSQACV